MNNLIKNACWQPGPCGERQFFSSVGPITYDEFSVNGCRTCSLTMEEGCDMSATDSYDLELEVGGRSLLRWGCRIRMIDAQSIVLAADFYDAEGCLLEEARYPVTEQVSCQFRQIIGRFPVPCQAQTVRLSIEFSGRTTGCTYFAPSAFLC